MLLKHYEELKTEFIRDAYYMVGDWLGEMLRTGQVSQQDYDWFCTKQGYSTLRDDVWPLMEQQYGLTRPKAWPAGMVIDAGIEEPLSKLIENMELGLEYIWNQARGFIFVEKGGVAVKLEPLSRYGWTICAGKGYPERLMRKLLKEESKQRPVLVLHDWDRDGKAIYETLGFPTRRTKHLDIALGERVVDLGLSEEHVRKLNLPTRPSPPKYKGIPRVELSGLSVLKVRFDIENPILAYVVSVMIVKGLKLSPTEVDKLELMERHMRWLMTEGLANVAEKAIEKVMEQVEEQEKFQGTAVKGELEDLKVIAPGVVEELVKSGLIQAQKTNWRYEDDLHEEALHKFSNQKLTYILKS